MCPQWTDRTDWMDQKVRIYNVIANSGWLKCGPWAAVNLNAQKKARAPHITTLQQFLGSISQIAPPIGLTKKMETKNLKYPLILLHLPQYFAHWHKIGNLQNTSNMSKHVYPKNHFSFHNVVSISPAAWPAWPYLHCPESHLGCRKIFKKCVSLADVCRRSLRSLIIFTVIMMLQWTVVTMKSLKSIDNLPRTGHSKWSNMLRVVGMSGLSEAKYCEIVSKPKRYMDPWRAATALQHRQIRPFPQHLLASASLLEPMAHHSLMHPGNDPLIPLSTSYLGCVVGIEHNQQISNQIARPSKNTWTYSNCAFHSYGKLVACCSILLFPLVLLVFSFASPVPARKRGPQNPAVLHNQFIS